ncbi:MAG: prolyl oligopeptidase family serine peptidase [Verrucomicrobiae bacterium]|nr:prolyl oligopeptidase family serine peptidase [Verrucomicrobiae bacterium]
MNPTDSDTSPFLPAALVLLAGTLVAVAQPLGQPDRSAPGDPMIQEYLARHALAIEAPYDEALLNRSFEDVRRAETIEEYFHMLGLSPRPDLTPLQPVVTGVLEGDGYRVENLHFQSRPGLYVTANLYRPPAIAPGERLPAILYVCGHSHRGRDGNKVAYQSHGIWFARHGYVCLVLDSLQLGEIASHHHGTYRLNRWWWVSRGYTPAGVEAWNGIRGIDYLVSRPDVDPARIGVTGISGGGAATFWIAAADPRVAAAAPVSGMADLESYLANRVINGHCDCMFLHNTFQWPWTRIASLVAPRPLLFVNSDRDPIFPMDANDRVIQRLERIYAAYGAGDRVDAVVSLGDHAYRADIRQAAYRFFNTHFKNDPRPVHDSEVDIVSEGSRPGPYPISPERLRVFPSDADLPADALNATIDQHFVPSAVAPDPVPGRHAEWRSALLSELRRVTFRALPSPVPSATRLDSLSPRHRRVQTEDGIVVHLHLLEFANAARAGQLLLVVQNEAEAGTVPDWVREAATESMVVLCEPRGVGATRWTRVNPPNYVERSLLLLGLTVDAGRIRDVLAVAAHLRDEGWDGSAAHRPRSVRVAGSGAAGVLAAYAAALDETLDGARLVGPPLTHEAPDAPLLLNVLRVADIPDVLGLIAPRPLSVLAADSAALQRTRTAYRAAEATDALRFD